MIEISVSAFASNRSRFEQDIKLIEESGADRIHFDIMDSKFVPSDGLTIDDYNVIRKTTNLPIDVHLMCVHNDLFINKLNSLAVTSIVFHPEAECDDNILPLLKKIKNKKNCGLALSPNVSLSIITKYIKFLDEVLILSSPPGTSGGVFQKNTYFKVKELEKIKLDFNPDLIISVDGSVKREHIEELKQLGANKIIIGREFFNQKFPHAFISEINRCLIKNSVNTPIGFS